MSNLFTELWKRTDSLNAANNLAINLIGDNYSYPKMEISNFHIYGVFIFKNPDDNKHYVFPDVNYTAWLFSDSFNPNFEMLAHYVKYPEMDGPYEEYPEVVGERWELDKRNVENYMKKGNN
jgi:hypothetical protein